MTKVDGKSFAISPGLLSDFERIQMMLKEADRSIQVGLVINLSKGATAIALTKCEWQREDEFAQSPADISSKLIAHYRLLADILPGGCLIAGIYFASHRPEGADRSELNTLNMLKKLLSLTLLIQITPMHIFPAFKLQPECIHSNIVAVRAFYPLFGPLNFSKEDELQVVVDAYKRSLSGDSACVELDGQDLSLDDIIDERFAGGESFKVMSFWSAIPLFSDFTYQGVVCCLALGLVGRSSVQQVVDSLFLDLQKTIRLRASSPHASPGGFAIRIACRPDTASCSTLKSIPLLCMASTLESSTQILQRINQTFRELLQDNDALTIHDLLPLESYSEPAVVTDPDPPSALLLSTSVEPPSSSASSPPVSKGDGPKKQECAPPPFYEPGPEVLSWKFRLILALLGIFGAYTLSSIWIYIYRRFLNP